MNSYRNNSFQWGPLAIGLYKAYLSSGLLVAILVWNGLLSAMTLGAYAVGVVFLPVGLKPLLIRTGTHRMLLHVREEIGERAWRGKTQRRRAQVERTTRDDALRKRRSRDPELPPNW